MLWGKKLKILEIMTLISVQTLHLYCTPAPVLQSTPQIEATLLCQGGQIGGSPPPSHPTKLQIQITTGSSTSKGTKQLSFSFYFTSHIMARIL